MKILKDFYDFLLESKLELTVGISERLEKLLLKIDHPISKSFLDLPKDNIKSDKITLVDYDSEDFSKFTYILPLKVVDLIKKYKKEDKEGAIKYLQNIDSETGNFIRLSRNTKQLWEEMRVTTSISKVVEKVFPGKYDASKGEDSRESFMNLVISKRKYTEDNIFINFKIVDGKDIIKYYNENRYEKEYGTSNRLYDSCMRYDRCSNYLKFYSQNKGVKMVILMSNLTPDKIIGRALLWDIEYIDNKKVENRKFMDRIYTVYDYDIDLFKEYAKNNGWLYKKNQNMDNDEDIIDTIDNKTVSVIRTSATFYENEDDLYPYMDTLKYLNVSFSYLTNFYNNKEGYQYYKLEDTRGDYEIMEDDKKIFVEYYGDYFEEDELIWCEFGEEFRLLEDAINLERYGEYATKEYAKDHMVYSEWDDDYYYKDDAVWSNYYESYIFQQDSILYYVENSSYLSFNLIYDNIEYMDYIFNDDKDIVFFYPIHKMYFLYKSDQDNFIKCKSLFEKGNKKIWVHKKWDKDKIFIMDGEYWINDSTDEDFYSLQGNVKLLGEKNNNIN